MASSNMHNLTTLIKRLEAATSRLEDMATSTVDFGSQNPDQSASAPETTQLVATSKSASAPAPPAPATPAAPAAPKQVQEPVPESIEEFDNFINTSVKKFVSLSDKIGGPLSKQAASVLKAFVGQRTFLLITTKSKKPDPSSPAYMDLLKPLQEQIMAVSDIRDANRGSPEFNQLSAVSESIGMLAWVTTDFKPNKHVDESLGSAQYWGNRVLKEYKEKDPKQVEWVQSYYQIFKDLSEYVKNNFQSGIPWNAQGVDPSQAMKQISEAAAPPAPAGPPAPSAGGPPPPPPPPPGPPPVFDIKEAAAPAAEAGGIGAVFNELNKGEAVTKGLRKVNPNEMTHKNPALRAGATVPQRLERPDSSSSQSSLRGKSPAPGKKPKPESMRTKKPPRKELDGNKWIIENYENESAPIEIEASIQHSILISRCSKTTIMIKGKANAISIDNSPRLSLIVESLVSSVDVIKSSNFALQVLGVLPTILMDQVDGAQVYLSKESTGTEVFSSKCSSVNLNIIEGELEDYKEVPLPEQLRTYIEDGKVKTEIVEHAG